MPEPTEEEIAAARALLRSLPRQTRQEAARKTIVLAQQARRLKPLLPCNCGGQEVHNDSCPVYRREAKRRSRANRQK